MEKYSITSLYDVYFIGPSRTVKKRRMPREMMLLLVPALRAQNFHVFAMICVGHKPSLETI